MNILPKPIPSGDRRPHKSGVCASHVADLGRHKACPYVRSRVIDPRYSYLWKPNGLCNPSWTARKASG